MTRIIPIQIISDSICPYCYIGKRRLERAITQAKKEGLDLEFTLQFKPFLLDPSLTSKPINKIQRYNEKFGAERVPKMIDYMTGVGKSEGINFSYGGVISQTLDSHRLIDLAYNLGGSTLQNNIVNNIYKAYFEEEKNIGDVHILGECAADAGMNKDDVIAYLKSDTGKHKVLQEIKKTGLEGVDGVPVFIINETMDVCGAQDPETFLQIFRDIARE